MPTPTINERPRRIISGYTSDWVACGGRLPVVYEIENTKWPTNSEDATNNVTAVADNGGFAQMTVAAHPYNAGDYVVFTNFDPEDNYNVVARVLSDDSANTFTVDIPFTASDTGNVQLYYFNYAIEVRVYAGIDSSHPHTAEDPISLIGTIKQLPDTDNIARVDVGQYVKTKLSSKYDPTLASWPNDLNAWKDFYIEYREVYLNSSDSFVDDSSNYMGKAVYNTLQFGNLYGGNLYGYVLDTATYAPEAKFLTLFDRPVKFRTVDTEISIITNEDQFDLQESGLADDRVENSMPGVTANFIGVVQTGFMMRSGGGRCYVVSDGGSGPTRQIQQFNLNTPYDISTRGLSAGTLSLSGVALTPAHGHMSPDGTAFWLTERLSNDAYIRQFSLSIAYDITTATSDGVLFVSAAAALGGIVFSEDGFKAYIVWSTGLLAGQVREYELATAFDILGTIDNTTDVTPLGSTTPNGIGLGTDDERLYIYYQTNETVYQFDFGTAADISTLSLSPASFYDISGTVSNTPNDLEVRDNSQYWINQLGSQTVYEFEVEGQETTPYSGNGYGVYRLPITTDPDGDIFDYNVSVESGSATTETKTFDIDELQ